MEFYTNTRLLTQDELMYFSLIIGFVFYGVLNIIDKISNKMIDSIITCHKCKYKIKEGEEE